MKKRTIFLSLTILVLIIALSFGQAIQFTLWQDDNALIFKLQHLEEQAGVFGPGPAGLGAYRYIVLPYIPIYEVFGMNIPIFYLYALFFYFLAAASVFLLAKYLTKNNIVALLSGAIFSAGFIGSDGILRLFNSVQTSYSVFFVSSFFLLLYRFIKTKHAIYYFLGLLFYFIALETAFIRTQYLILPTVIFFILFLDWGKRPFILKNIFLVVPFLFIYRFVFLRSSDARADLVKDYVMGILNGNLDYTHSLFGTLGNIILPDPITNFLFDAIGNLSLDYTNRLLMLELLFLGISFIIINFVFKNILKITRVLMFFPLVIWFVLGMIYFQNSEKIFVHSETVDTLGVFANFVGGLFIIILTVIFITAFKKTATRKVSDESNADMSSSFIGGNPVSKNGEDVITIFRKNEQVGKLSLFLLSWLLANILVYSVYLPFSPLESINRYLVHSLAAYAIFIPLLLYYAWGRRVTIVLSSFIVLTNIFWSLDYQQRFIVERTVPTRIFYQDLRKYIPELSKGAVVYFDVANDEISEQQFRDFFSVASMPDETAIAIRYGIDRYDFKITKDFNEFLSLIQDKSLDLTFSFFYDSTGLKNTTKIMRVNLVGKEVEIDSKNLSNLSLVTPGILEFSAKVIPKISIKQNCPNFPGDRVNLFNYLLSRDNFYKNVKVQTSSQEKYQANDFLKDGKFNTLWRGSRGWWHENKKEIVTVDLGSPKKINQLVWINGYANSTPTKYKIEVSLNGESWDVVRRVDSDARKENTGLVTDNFKTSKTRYIRLIIEETFDNDAPAIGEIEAVEEDFEGINKEKIEKLKEIALCANNLESLNSVNQFINKIGIEGVVSWKTDKSNDNVVRLSLQADGLYHSYKVFLPAGGTKLNGLRIEPWVVPVDISVIGLKLIYSNNPKW